MADLRDVRIFRESSPITASEWMTLVEADSELEPTRFLEGRNPRTMALFQVPTSLGATWKAHPDKIEFCFQLKQAGICASWIDQPTLKKAHEIAEKLGASVVTTID